MVKRKKINLDKKYQTVGGYPVISLQYIPRKKDTPAFEYPIMGQVVIQRSDPVEMERRTWTDVGIENIDKSNSTWDLVLLGTPIPEPPKKRRRRKFKNTADTLPKKRRRRRKFKKD